MRCAYAEYRAASEIFQVMREGKDVTLIAFGKLVGYHLKAAEILEKEGISAEVCEAHRPVKSRAT